MAQCDKNAFVPAGAQAHNITHIGIGGKTVRILVSDIIHRNKYSIALHRGVHCCTGADHALYSPLRNRHIRTVAFPRGHSAGKDAVVPIPHAPP